MVKQLGDRAFQLDRGSLEQTDSQTGVHLPAHVHDAIQVRQLGMQPAADRHGLGVVDR